MGRFTAWQNIAIGLALSLALVSCDSQDTETAAIVTEPYVTNAEYVLGEIQNNGGTGIVVQLNPQLSNLCTHMMVEISALGANGEWAASNILYPGKDKRDSMGEVLIENQPHFAALSKPGKHAVTGLGCQTHGQGMQGIRGLLAFFDAEPGKLKYVGEITYKYVSGGHANAQIADRKVDVAAKISERYPDLLEHFHVSLATLPAPVPVESPPPKPKLKDMKTVKAVKAYRLSEISPRLKDLRERMEMADNEEEYKRLRADWSFLEEERKWLILSTENASTLKRKIVKRAQIVDQMKALASELGEAHGYFIIAKGDAPQAFREKAERYNDMRRTMQKDYSY